MTAQIAAQRSAYEVLAPTSSGWAADTPLSVATTAGIFNLNSLWGGTSKKGVTIERVVRGSAWVRVQARGGTLYVRLAPAGSSATITTGRGLAIADGAYEDFLVTAAYPLLEHIGSAAMLGILYFSSHNPGNLEPQA